MDSPKAKSKKGIISKTWERCKSLSGRSKGNYQQAPYKMKMNKSKSWPRDLKVKRVAPEGCLSIYVGPQKERFVIKTECVNHPLFKMLLEEAESEYGYSSEGPLMLPCQVHHFIKVLMEMDSQHHHRSSYRLLTTPPPTLNPLWLPTALIVS